MVKKVSFMCILLVLVAILIGCSTSSASDGKSIAKAGNTAKADDVGKNGKLYITDVALPRDGSGLMPGTFTLPNGTKVPLGSVVEEGDYLYTVGSAKVVDAAYNVDYLASSEQARMVCRESLSNYLNASVSTSSSRQSVNVGGKNSTSSRTASNTYSESVLSGMEDCGFGLADDGTSYVLCRVKFI